MTWMQEHSGLLQRSEMFHCDCRGPHQVDEVLCVYMTHIKMLKVEHCLKLPITVQLVNKGLFPCTPVQPRPRLAVSMVMLDWAATLFQYMALNVQAWMMTVEIMLQHEGYHFKTANSFCHCFNNVLVHSQLLIRIDNAKVNHMADSVPIPAMLLSPGVALSAEASQGTVPNPDSLSATPDSVPHSINAPDEAHIAPMNSTNLKIHVSLDECTPTDERQYQNAPLSPIFFHHDVPSDYLHARCLCCFSSTSSINPELLANCIVSFNANFQLIKIRDHDQQPQY